MHVFVFLLWVILQEREKMLINAASDGVVGDIAQLLDQGANVDATDMVSSQFQIIFLSLRLIHAYQVIQFMFVTF